MLSNMASLAAEEKWVRTTVLVQLEAQDIGREMHRNTEVPRAAVGFRKEREPVVWGKYELGTKQIWPPIQFSRYYRVPR